MKPDAEELQVALAEARRMREQGEDPFHLAKALLNLNYRQQYYDALRQAVEHYFRSGQTEHEHTLLLKAVEQVHHIDERSAGLEHEDLGLG
jgi:hypothetical protein